VGVPFQLQQVVLNLVTNAQQALQNHPHPRDIELVGFQDGAQVVIEVRDNGPGISPAALPRLFEPFYTTKAAGTGLGLAISATIVQEHGGRLTADNRPDGGAVFRLTLPAAELVTSRPPPA
jgi:C4-dicarboxylate-specific signal transduction histidine kinase